MTSPWRTAYVPPSGRYRVNPLFPDGGTQTYLISSHTRISGWYADQVACNQVLTRPQNFGILVAFAVAFTAALLWFTQRSTESAVTTAVTLFKRRSTKIVTAVRSPDEEKGVSSDLGVPKDDRAPTAIDSAVATPALRMDSIYTWQNLNYRVPIGDGLERQLLEDVSGYVAPGRLTALMGESGAGVSAYLCTSRFSSGEIYRQDYAVERACAADRHWCRNWSNACERPGVTE